MEEKKRALQSFLTDKGLDPSQIDPVSVLADFIAEMEEGLAGRESSLAMIPTFVGIDKPVPANKPVIAIDAGGTHLRIATVTFNRMGEAEVANFSQRSMPGVEQELSREEFFQSFVEAILPVADTAESVGFCFSYPAEISPEQDGKLLTWSKEIKAPEVQGEWIGKNIFSRLAERGSRLGFSLLNDTVATLLAGKSLALEARFESYVGFILGTGTNTAYVERNRNITKRNDLPLPGSMAINVESGNFGKSPRGPLDRDFDAVTVNPGYNAFEKMISGAYLGGLCLEVLKAASQEGFFSQRTAKLILSLSELATAELSGFLNEPPGDGPFSANAVAAGDKEILVRLLQSLIQRAALLAAINISAAVLKSGCGLSPVAPVAVNIDGSTFYKTPGIQDHVKNYLTSLLGSHGIHYELIRVEDSPLLGAAVAGLTR
jgi:hexokinase